jgi:peptide/nickel transport system permease protein
MSIDAEIAVEIAPGAVRPAKRKRADPAMVISSIVLGMLVLLGVVGPLFWPYSSTDVVVLDRLKPPGSVLSDGSIALLGTDALGQQLTVVMINGLTTSLVVASVSLVIATIIGIALGLLAGYAGKWVDTVISRGVDILLVFPSILLAIVIAGLLGPSLTNLILILGLTRWVAFTRITRASTLSLRERDWVKASKVVGVPWPLIIVRHILPFLAGPLATVATLEFAAFVMAESALSFLGIGLPSSAVSLGKTISEGRDHLLDAYWITTYPGLLLVVLVVAIGLLGDSLSQRYGKVR